MIFASLFCSAHRAVKREQERTRSRVEQRRIEICWSFFSSRDRGGIVKGNLKEKSRSRWEKMKIETRWRRRKRSRSKKHLRFESFVMFDDGISVAIAERDEGGGTESSSIIHKRFFNQLARLSPRPLSLAFISISESNFPSEVTCKAFFIRLVLDSSKLWANEGS